MAGCEGHVLRWKLPLYVKHTPRRHLTPSYSALMSCSSNLPAVYPFLQLSRTFCRLCSSSLGINLTNLCPASIFVRAPSIITSRPTWASIGAPCALHPHVNLQAGTRPPINSHSTCAGCYVTVGRGRWEEDVFDIAGDDDKSGLADAPYAQLSAPPLLL
ncbi:hypothetical protein PENSPDRAFT_276090 [Peniophora sp. CONT]|nr:hypothetical protein PENSPDRAFT_276090 [Peniophora sp. CONT]